MSELNMKRSDALALRAAKLASRGWTQRNIAETVGVCLQHVQALIIKGERLQEAQP